MATPTSRSSTSCPIPAATSELCGFWAARVRDDAGAPTVDLVAGPTTGGVILAFETARQLGVRSIFAEEVRTTTARTHRDFRRGFQIEPGERVLLVDDILTTGGSLLAMLPAVEAMGGDIVECVVLVDRSGGRATLTSPTTGRTYPLRSLWQLDLPTYEAGAETCPRCADGTPLYAPGSTGTGRPGSVGPRPEMEPRFRNYLVLAAVLFIGLATAMAVYVGRPGTRDPDQPPDATQVVGVIVRVDSEGLTDVRGFGLRTDADADMQFSLERLQNGADVPARAPRRAPGVVPTGRGLVRVGRRDRLRAVAGGRGTVRLRRGTIRLTGPAVRGR